MFYATSLENYKRISLLILNFYNTDVIVVIKCFQISLEYKF